MSNKRAKEERRAREALARAEQPQETASVARAMMYLQKTEEQRWTGPMPSPQDVERYESIYPGAAKRFFDYIDREQAKRHELTDTVQAAALEDAKEDRRQKGRGQVFAFIIAIVAFVAACVLGYLKQPVVAGICVGATLGSLIIAFLGGNRTDNRED